MRHKPYTLEEIYGRCAYLPATGCWVWLGAKDLDKGYAVGQLQGKSIRLAHVVWELANRRKFPEGREAGHTCDFPPCVNPAHIEAITHAQNISDAYARGLNHQPRHAQALLDTQVASIKRLLSLGYTTRELGEQFAVSHTTISKIKRGLRYKDIPTEEARDVA